MQNLKRTANFFTRVGFKFDPQFTDENTTCLIIDKDLFAMLLVEKFFQTFTRREITDTATHAEAIIALTAESREKEDEMVNRALAAGGTAYREPESMGGCTEKVFRTSMGTDGKYSG